MAEHAVRIPQLYQARWWLRVIRTLLLLLAVVLVVGSVDRPEAGLLLVAPVLIWAVRTVGRRPVRLDTAAGSLTFPHRWLGRRRVTLADDVTLLDDGRQSLVLQVGADACNRVPILRWTGQVRRSQRPEVLDALAAALDRHAPETAPVADRLRAQAAFLAAGGRLVDSPLIGSVRYSDRWTGVGSGVADLLATLLPFR
jgi:hypothetical protein